MSERKLLFPMTAEQADAFTRLVEAAGRGDGGAACRLGDMYRAGLGGLRYSPKETYRWYAKSALAGDPNGQNNLGACYEHGLGCAQSYAKAVKWYRLSVAQRLSTASMNLGYCYLRGHGVAADKVEALRLFREAVERGEERAQQEVDRLESEMGLRVSQPVPAGTQQVRPWMLGSRVPPRDGPPEQLRHPQTSEHETTATTLDLTAIDTDVPAAQHQASTDFLGHTTRFANEARPGEHLGLVGGVRSPPPPWEDEEVRRQLVEILSAETEIPVDDVDGPTEEELFPIFAEGGLKPDDLVEDVAERYAAYLANRMTGKE